MKLYLRYLGMSVRAAMQYKASFVFLSIGQLLVSFNVLIGMYYMFARFSAVENYTFNQVLICFAVIMTSFSLAECFFRAFDTFASIISQGEFDRMLLRPRGAVFQVIASKIELTRIGRILQALLALAYAVPTSGIAWTPDKIAVLAIMIVGGTALFAGLFVVYAACCFFTLEGLEFINIFTDGGREFGSYPISVYGRGILKFFTYIIPLACVQYYPLQYLLDRTHNAAYALTPIAGIAFLLPCFALWNFGLKHYKSTGS